MLFFEPFLSKITGRMTLGVNVIYMVNERSLPQEEHGFVEKAG